MSHNPLVSESESSSACASPAFQSTDDLPTVSQLHISPLKSSLNESQSQKHSKPEKTPTDDEGVSSSSLDDGVIKNEMFKSKITMAASLVLEQLPPDTKQVVEQITNPTRSDKITIRCMAIGSTPVLSPNVFKISYHQPVTTLIKFIMKKLKRSLPQGSALHCYVNNSFAPAPDEIVGCLFDHFATGGELVVSYCTVVAFG